MPKLTIKGADPKVPILGEGRKEGSDNTQEESNITMKKSKRPAKEGRDSASKLIDAKIAELSDGCGEILARGRMHAGIIRTDTNSKLGSICGKVAMRVRLS